MSIPTIEQQINCVHREIRMREGAYPRWIEQKRMTKQQADHELAAMRQVLETLKAARRVLAAVSASHGVIRQAEGGSIVPTAVEVDAEPLFELQEAAGRSQQLL